VTRSWLPRLCSGLTATQVARPLIRFQAERAFCWGKERAVGACADEDRARGCRTIATKLRARADAMTHEGARQGMLQAAGVWDQLADFADRRVNVFIPSIPPQRHPLS